MKIILPFTLQKPCRKYKCCIWFYVFEEKSAQNPTQETMPELLFLKFAACAFTTTCKKNNSTSFAYSNCTTTFFKMKPSSLPPYADSCDHFGDGPRSRIKLSATMELHSKSWWLHMREDLPGSHFVLCALLSYCTVLQTCHPSKADFGNTGDQVRCEAPASLSIAQCKGTLLLSATLP